MSKDAYNRRIDMHFTSKSPVWQIMVTVKYFYIPSYNKMGQNKVGVGDDGAWYIRQAAVYYKE